MTPLCMYTEATVVCMESAGRSNPCLNLSWARFALRESKPHPNPSFHISDNFSPKYVMTCSKSKDSIRTGPGQSPHRLDPQHGVLVTASHSPGEHLYSAPFSVSRSPAVSGGAVLAAFCDHLPRFLYSHALWTPWEKICICSPHFAFVSLLPSTLPVWFLLLSVRGFLLPNI